MSDKKTIAQLSSVPNIVAAAGAGNVGLYDAVRL